MYLALQSIAITKKLISGHRKFDTCTCLCRCLFWCEVRRCRRILYSHPHIVSFSLLSLRCLWFRFRWCCHLSSKLAASAKLGLQSIIFHQSLSWFGSWTQDDWVNWVTSPLILNHESLALAWWHSFSRAQKALACSTPLIPEFKLGRKSDIEIHAGSWISLWLETSFSQLTSGLILLSQGWWSKTSKDIYSKTPIR